MNTAPRPQLTPADLVTYVDHLSVQALADETLTEQQRNAALGAGQVVAGSLIEYMGRDPRATVDGAMGALTDDLRHLLRPDARAARRLDEATVMAARELTSGVDRLLLDPDGLKTIADAVQAENARRAAGATGGNTAAAETKKSPHEAFIQELLDSRPLTPDQEKDRRIDQTGFATFEMHSDGDQGLRSSGPRKGYKQYAEAWRGFDQHSVVARESRETDDPTKVVVEAVAMDRATAEMPHPTEKRKVPHGRKMIEVPVMETVGVKDTDGNELVDISYAFYLTLTGGSSVMANAYTRNQSKGIPGIEPYNAFTSNRSGGQIFWRMRVTKAQADELQHIINGDEERGIPPQPEIMRELTEAQVARLTADPSEPLTEETWKSGAPEVRHPVRPPWGTAVPLHVFDGYTPGRRVIATEHGLDPYRASTFDMYHSETVVPYKR